MTIERDIDTLTVSMPGAVYDHFCDPRATSVPDEEGWPTPIIKSRGKGKTVHYYGVTPEMARLMIEHVQMVAESWAFYSDPGDRRGGQNGIRWAENADSDMRRIERVTA